MKMLNLVGTPKTKLRAIRANCCLLAVASRLGSVEPHTFSARLSRLGNSPGMPDASDQVSGKAALRPASGAPDVALSLTSIRIPGPRSGAARRRAPHPDGARMAIRIAYRPHAPPRRILSEFSKHNS